MRATDTISVVMPTYERADAIMANFHSILALEGIEEIVVVCDGPSPDSIAAIERFGDPRVRIHQLPTHVGAPAARMEGVRTVRSTWILVVEDDCQFPPDYGQVLLAEAARLNADIVGAPWVYDPNGDLEGRLARLMANRVERLSLESPAGTFPQGAIETPFMPNLALVSAAVFDRVHFDPGFRGNSWREETAFYISAVRAGFRCFLTDRTHSVQIGQWQGGQRRSRLAYEYWVWRNEVRFMRLHGKWLTERNFVRRRRLPSVRLVAARLFAYAAAGVNARVARLRRRSLAS